MDSYDIEIVHLIPPVRNRYTAVERESPQELKRGSQYQQQLDLTSKPANNIIPASQSLRAEIKTSSSLILNKITNKLLPKQFSILKITKQHAFSILAKDKIYSQPKNNTVIKIIVPPITAETQTSKDFFKRKHIIKKVQKTVSTTDNCIHDKSLYLSRTPKQPIYDIKESSSAEFFQADTYARKYSKHEELSLSHITYTKQILDSLRMDHKRRKHKSNRFIVDDPVSPRSARKETIVEQECTSNDTNINKVFDDMNSRKNRVTIVGRFGINENDQYILNCAATVNDKPIETHIEQQSICSASTDRFDNNNRTSKTTKATQATMSMFLAKDIKNTTLSDKTIQCNCENITDVATKISYSEFGKPTDLASERKTPLIVISVYPTKEAMGDVKCLDDLIQVHQLQTCPPSGQTCFPPTNQNQNPKDSLAKKSNVKSNTNVNKSVTKSFRSRSPSPAVRQKTIEKVENNVMDKKHPRVLKNHSPDRQLTGSKVIPKQNRSKSKSIIVNSAFISKVDPSENRQEKLHEPNIERSKIKKAIVDKYTQNLLKPTTSDSNDFTKIIRTRHKNDASSNVTINIDGDKEQYRVLFLHDNVNTDLSIRKTVKSQDMKPLDNLKRKDTKCNTANSTYKQLKLAKETKRGKQKILRNQKRDNDNAYDPDVAKRISTIKIRDSLDIGHWRDEDNGQYKPNVRQSNIFKPKKSDGNYKDRSVKHYRGDKCCVPNPAARDQEIRELLGIKKHRAEKFNNPQDSLHECNSEAEPINCLGPGKCVDRNPSPSHRSVSCCNETNNKKKKIEKSKFVTKSTQYDENIVHAYKQRVLNRNIQVFLQLDQYTKQKHIILSRKKYDKVKKTIQKKLSSKISQERRKYNAKNCTIVSIGEIRKTRKQYNVNEKVNRAVQAKHNAFLQQDTLKASDRLCNNEENKPLLLLHSTENDAKDENEYNASSRQVVSSMDIRYASMMHMKHVTFSSSDLKCNMLPESLLSNLEKSPSIQTIFKGHHKKSVTPNLGTSACSLYSDEAMYCFKNNNPVYSSNKKPKKPFLRRLLSCLVMRSGKVSGAILPPVPESGCSSLVDSFDSYHLSTSFGGIEMTSSIYDTSVSFYSNHAILPIASIKRGFFSSVRGFLMNLKGR